jgi:hypothetical protein
MDRTGQVGMNMSVAGFFYRGVNRQVEFNIQRSNDAAVHVVAVCCEPVFRYTGRPE